MSDAGGPTYCLGLAGPVPDYLVEQIHDRFGPVTLSATGGPAVLDGRIADQAALRALLALVWDAGVEVRSLVVSHDTDRLDGAPPG